VRKRRTQAFRQAPWRLQVRWTGRTMLWVVLCLTVGGMYLAVNAKVARAGREVLTLQSRQSDLERENAELTADLAELTAPDLMLARAASVGFKPAGPPDVSYIEVEGYQAPAAFVAPRPPASIELGQGMLSPAYTETLGEWLVRWLGIGGGNR